MNAGAGDLAGGVEAGERGVAADVGLDASHHVVRGGTDGDEIAVQVQAVTGEEAGDSGEPGGEVGCDVAHVEVHGTVEGLVDDGAGDDVAGGEFQLLVVLGHEALAARVDEVGSFAAEGFAKEEARGSLLTEGGGMELVELHVHHGGSGAVGGGDAVSGGYLRVGGVAEDLSRAAGGQQDGSCVDVTEGTGFGEQRGSGGATGGDEEIDHGGPFAQGDVGEGADVTQEAGGDLAAGGVAVGVEDAGEAVGSFAGSHEFAVEAIEVRSPPQQFFDAGRSLLHQDACGGLVDEAVSGGQGVFEMQSDVFGSAHGDGDAALRVGGVGLSESFLGDDEDTAVLGQGDRRAKPGDAGSRDQEAEGFHMDDRTPAGSSELSLCAVRYDGETVPSIQIKTPSTAYPVILGSGLLADLASRLRRLTPGKRARFFLVTSPQIWALWSATVLASFEAAKIEAPTILFIPPGETHKRLSTVERLAEDLVEAKADRDTVLLAFGGGVVGDITGFLAAIYMRGIAFVQLPTTLLAQVDSSVGGKTGVNLRAGKNLLGSFHHPLAVFADTDVLGTLPAAELRSGLQESIKAGVIRDPKLFRLLETQADAVLTPEHPEHAEVLSRVVAASVRVKAEVVGADERESGLRMILNFGHTLGHAIESATRYRQLLHGEAVAWGSIAATHLALARGTLSAKDGDRIIRLILRYGPLRGFRANAEKLVALTSRDKKNRSGSLSFILPVAIGEVEIVRDVTEAELHSASAEMLSLMKQQAQTVS